MASSTKSSSKQSQFQSTDPPSSDRNADAQIKAALDVLERCAATPLVSGDLPTWVADVQHAWSEAAAQIHFHAKHLHPRQFEEITTQDPELLPRVDLLKAEDVAIEGDRAALNERIARVAGHAPNLEPDEEKARKLLDSLSDDVMALILRVRKQNVALQTWYVEAFNRDRGAVD